MVADETLDLIREMMNDKAFKDFNLVGKIELPLPTVQRFLELKANLKQMIWRENNLRMQLKK